MPGRRIDLSLPVKPLPDALPLDTSVVVPQSLPRLRIPGPALTLSQIRVNALFADMEPPGTLGFVASTTFAELPHVVLRVSYAEDLRHFPDPSTGRPFASWTRLYKARPELTRRDAGRIEAVRLALERGGVEIRQSDVLRPIAGQRRFEQETIRLVPRYRRDSADVAILLDARRAGITNLFSEDPDWRRAVRDFDLSTWR